VCDNDAAVKACKRKRMQSVFHRTEGGHDLISTIHYLQESWFQDIDVHYEWVKGHSDNLNRDPTKFECLHIELMNFVMLSDIQREDPMVLDLTSDYGAVKDGPS
jgi:hypothetical protein